jgi:hypothetical protein
MNNEPTAEETASAALGAQILDATDQQKRLALGLISTCHTLNHLQYSITSVIFPVVMKELGFGLFQLGVISAVSSFVGQGLQVVYGFITGMFRRTVILGAGNVIVGITAMLQYFVGSYPQLLAARSLMPVPVPSIRWARASCLAITQRLRLGAHLPSLGGQLVRLSGLRWLPGSALYGVANRLVVFGIFSLAMGLTLFLLRDYTSAADEGEDKKPVQTNVNAYLLCLKNRKICYVARADGRGCGKRNRRERDLSRAVFYGAIQHYRIERRNAFDNHDGSRAHRSAGHRLALGPQRQTHRHHPSDASVIGNHDRMVSTALPAGFTFLFELDSVWKRCSSARLAHTDHDRRFCQPGAYRCGVLDLLFRGLHLRTDLDLIIGYMMDHFGFAPAFYVAASTYIAGMLLLTLVKEESARSEKV